MEGAKIDGLVRKESYELPLEAIREMIINAHCHRNLIDDSCVQVAIYDDRLEVSSPGGLYNGLTYEELMNGHSKIRNRTIANVFNKMGFVESWGTGVKRILGAAKSYGLPTPKFQVFDDMFRVNLFRNVFPMEEQKGIGETSEKDRNNSRDDLNDTQKQILELVMNHEHIAGGSSVYEVINQYSALKTDENRKAPARDRRFDVTLLINGLPLIHIELKNKRNCSEQL